MADSSRTTQPSMHPSVLFVWGAPTAAARSCLGAVSHDRARLGQLCPAWPACNPGALPCGQREMDTACVNCAPGAPTLPGLVRLSGGAHSHPLCPNGCAPLLLPAHHIVAIIAARLALAARARPISNPDPNQNPNPNPTPHLLAAGAGRWGPPCRGVGLGRAYPHGTLTTTQQA